MDDDDNGAWWAAHELELEHQQILNRDPAYQLWLDRLNYQAEIERVQLRLPFPSHTH